MIVRYFIKEVAVMEERDFTQEIKEILDSTTLTEEEKREKLLQYHESDIAVIIDDMDEDERHEIFKILGNEFAGDVLLHAEDIGDVVEDLEPEEAADIIEQMDADDAIDVLEELDEETKEEIVSLMDKEAVSDIKDITKYDDDMIGSEMTNNYITISETDSIKTAMKKVVEQASENDNVTNIYVVDEGDHLLGMVELRDLIIARNGVSISSIMKTNYPSFKATTLISDCLNDLKEYKLDTYPIVDDNNELLGVITQDAVTDISDAEFQEDYAKLAGLTQEEEQGESVFASVRKRIPWLLILLVLGLVQAFTMSGFDAVVATLPAIVFFQTLVLDMAGNSGTQSLAVTIRLISTNEVSRKHVILAILKEIRVGLLNGLILGVLSFAFVLLYLWVTNNGVETQVISGKTITEAFTWANGIKGASIVGIALVVAMTVSSLIGTIMPLFFMKIHIDPAVASGPFITTINDITALLIYYGLAAALFEIAF